MAFVTMNFFSRGLGKMTEMSVFMPENNTPDRPAKVLYLLHGLSDNHTNWDRWARMELHADGAGICVVMPDGGTSFYCDSEADNYFTLVSRDIPEVVENTFNVSRRREDTFVAGLSMGGYGAVKLGLTMPEKFAAVYAMSSAIGFDKNRALFSRNGLLFREEARESCDPVALAGKALADKKTLPDLHLFCGDNDFLFDENNAFADFLKREGVNVSYTVDGGYGHEWRYWELCLGRAIGDILSR